MPTRCSSFIATSLDGFISRPDGSIDWLDEANRSVPTGEDCGYSAYIDSVDAIVMGRNTFELALSFEEWPYEGKALYVLSSTLGSLPSRAPQTVSLHSMSPTELVALASSRGHGHLYVDGGRTIQGFVAAGLLVEITITVVPVLLGVGRPLFGPLPASDVRLEHLASRVFPFGFVQNRYAFVLNAA